MVTYWVFMLPMIFVMSVCGFVIGWFVGRRRWGLIGALTMSLLLGLTPATTGYFVGMYSFYRFISTSPYSRL